MRYTELGTTGPRVSQLSLGAGGASKLGLNGEGTEDEARQVVERALEHGITLVDTAEAYGTEQVVGAAIEGVDRDEVVLSTKCHPYDDDDELLSPDGLEASLEGSLERLGTDYVDVYHLHAVTPGEYDYALETLRPRMEALTDAGRIDHVGITESVSADPEHEMLERAVEDGWDVVMVGFNLLNHSARERVLEPARNAGIGTIGMVAVRNALADPAELEATVRSLLDDGILDPGTVDPAEPFGFLVEGGDASDLIDAAYRFAAHEPAMDTTLTGTANPEHLAANVASVEKGPLPEADREQLEERFGHVDSVIGN